MPRSSGATNRLDASLRSHAPRSARSARAGTSQRDVRYLASSLTRRRWASLRAPASWSAVVLHRFRARCTSPRLTKRQRTGALHDASRIFWDQQDRRAPTSDTRFFQDDGWRAFRGRCTLFEGAITLLNAVCMLLLGGGTMFRGRGETLFVRCTPLDGACTPFHGDGRRLEIDVRCCNRPQGTFPRPPIGCSAIWWRCRASFLPISGPPGVCRRTSRTRRGPSSSRNRE